ncbi:hypothetical protein M405DRAFT_858208 [Rhizopogon salebrosus TDB-379]|nr:hypothetical protein M405DRAFT_858208 [Rhizopogon salebrosus TDB-379]
MAYPMRLVGGGRRIARSLQWRDSSASASFVSPIPSPEGPPPTTTPVVTSSGFSASSQALAAALSIVGFIILGIVFWRLRAWRRKSTQGAASISDKGDLERQKDRWLAPSTTAPLSLDTVAAPPGVAWAPQIRSISGPEPVREDFKPPPPKRSRSPPPLVSKPSQDPFVDPRPKSVPPKSPRTLDVESAIGISPPSSPPSYALSVSGYQVRGLSTQEKGTRDWED